MGKDTQIATINQNLKRTERELENLETETEAQIKELTTRAEDAEASLDEQETAYKTTGQSA
ncbi:MAG: hypothetical protein R3C11_14925 [Planctomycetaceae bacterium]